VGKHRLFQEEPVNFSKVLVPTVMIALVGLGCAKPSFDINRVQVGMSEDQVFGNLGKPSLAIRQGNVRYLEYETFDQDKWFGVGRKENVQRFFVRLVEGRVESFGDRKNLDPAKIPTGWADADPRPITDPKPLAEPKPSSEPKVEPVAAKAGPAAPFDLRTELEKLEKLKKDGLITEAEFKELRQRALDKAKAQ
jgi:outer membrane protein assembly factor BamE (lipoprotein component of BamABCDE complex)